MLPTQIRDILIQRQKITQRQQRRLAKKIHDHISQKMTMLALQLSLASVEEKPAAGWGTQCDKWSDMVMDLGQSLRDLALDLHPRLADASSFGTILRTFAHSYAKKVPCVFSSTRDDMIVPPEIAHELYDMLREIFADVLEPANISRAEIHLTEMDGAMLLRLAVVETDCSHGTLTDEALAAFDLDARLAALDGCAACERSANESVLRLTVPIQCAQCVAA